jgi:hypothetical protein
MDRFFDLNLGLNRDDSSKIWNRKVDKRRRELGFSCCHLLPDSGLDVVCVLLEVVWRVSVKEIEKERTN